MPDFHQQFIGAPFPLGGASIAINSYTFVNTTDQIEWIFQVPDNHGAGSLVITRLGYRLTSVTGTSPVMKISLQGVDASGNPDGVIKGGGTPASATFTPAGSATWNWVNLANAYTAARGEFLAIVIGYNSGTLSGANTPVIGVTCSTVTSIGIPYETQNVAGVRTRSNALSIYGFGSSTTAFGMPVQSVTATNFSTTAERALRFVIDPTAASNYTLGGARWLGQSPAAAKSTKLILYSGTTPLQTTTWDSDAVSTNALFRHAVLHFQDAALTPLSGGGEYRISLQPQDAANNLSLIQLDFAAAADLEALPGGTNWYLSTRATGGATAWTDVTTSRPLIELLVTDWTVPAPGVIMATG